MQRLDDKGGERPAEAGVTAHAYMLGAWGSPTVSTPLLPGPSVSCGKSFLALRSSSISIWRRRDLHLAIAS